MGKDQEPRLVRVTPLEREEPEEYLIPEGTTRLGRSRGFGICLKDTTVSRFHCYFVRTGSVVRVHDGESKNPARLDGEEVNGQCLKVGQTLRVGNCEFVYRGPQPPPSSGVSSQRRAGRPRSRTRTRSAAARTGWGPGLTLLMLLLLILGGLLWLKVSPSFLEENADRPEGVSMRRLDQLQQEIATLRAAQERHRAEAVDPTSAKHRQKIDTLSRRVADLHAELEDEKRRDRESPTRSAWHREGSSKDDPTEMDKEAAEWAILDREFELLPERSRRSRARQSRATPATSVVVERPSHPSRSRGEIKALVKLLCDRIDDYGTQLVLPSSLQPDLNHLSHSPGKTAAEGTLDVYEHTQHLLKQTQASIEFNERRKESLLKQARRAEGREPGSPQGNYPKDGGYTQQVGPKVESDQRLLELSEKARQIHESHREHLLLLKATVLSSVENLTGPQALLYLRSRFTREADEDLCRALLRVFETKGFRSAIPTLSRKLGSARSGSFKDAIRKTLTNLVGTDLGEKSGPWKEWWTSHRPEKQVDKDRE